MVSASYGPWKDLIDSVRARRYRDALFFKPACLIAVIDLIEEGAIDPSSMDVDHIVKRVDEIVRSVHKGRADMRWRPVWHLSNDGAWVFTKGNHRVSPKDFEPARKPDSFREWRSSFDQLAVPTEMMSYWHALSTRATLRSAAIAMLEEGDAACRSLALSLAFTGAKAVSERQSARGGQGFISNPAVRKAVEVRAMELARLWLENEGWAVEDRSACESYDLLGTRGQEHLYVEVKGTTSAGEVIELTRLEVEFAAANKNMMALAVVSGIEVHHTDSGPEASGGTLIVRRSWAPDTRNLRPIAFSYRLESSI